MITSNFPALLVRLLVVSVPEEKYNDVACPHISVESASLFHVWLVP